MALAKKDTKNKPNAAKTTPAAPKQEVAKRDAPPPPAKTSGGEQLPEHMRAYAGQGTEGIGTGDIEMPRIKLIQGISPELQTFDGLRIGDFFHTMTEDSLGQELVIVPVYIDKRFVLWRPRPPIDMGGILARADDGVHWSPSRGEFTVKIDKKGNTAKWVLAETVDKSGLAAWGTYDPSDPNSPPAATLCYTLVCALPDHPDIPPVAIFLQRSAIKPARKLMGKMKISRAPIFGTRYKMSSFTDTQTGTDQQYQAFQFAADGLVMDEDEFRRYEGYYQQFKLTGHRIKLEDTEDAPLGDRTAQSEAARETRY